MGSRSIDPVELAFRGQSLSQGEKSVKRAETHQHESKILSIIFFLDAFRCNEQHDPVREILQCTIFSNVTVGRGAQSNLREKELEKEQGWRVQRVSRQVELPGHKLFSRPNKKKTRRTGLEDECRPLFHRTKRQDRENQNTAQAENKD